MQPVQAVRFGERQGGQRGGGEGGNGQLGRARKSSGSQARRWKEGQASLRNAGAAPNKLSSAPLAQKYHKIIFFPCQLKVAPNEENLLQVFTCSA